MKRTRFFVLTLIFISCVLFLLSCKINQTPTTSTPDPVFTSEPVYTSSPSPEPLKYTVNYTCGEGGEISGTAFQELFEGEESSPIIAIPNENYYFIEWSDGVKTPSRSDIVKNEDVNVTAIFGEKIKVVFRCEPNTTGTIIGESSQFIIPDSETSEITASPNSGYRFVKWNDGDTNPSKKVSANEPKIVVAFFEEIENIPNLYITTCDKSSITSKEEYKDATLKLDSIVLDVSIEELSCKIKGHGNSSWDNFKNSKPSYNLKLSEKVELAGVGSVPGKQYVLLSNHSDALMLRNFTALTLGSKLSSIDYTVDFTFVNLYVNGKLMGLYQLCEKIKVGETRIDIEVDDTGEETDTGYLLELDQRAYKESDNVYFYLGDTDFTISIKSDGKSKKQKSYITEYMTKFYNACLSGNKDKIAEYADIDSIVDMFILQEFTKNRDAGFASFFMVKEKGGLIKFTCPWDFDLSLGNDNMFRKTTDLVTLSKGGIYNDGNPFFKALYSCEWFKSLISDRLKEVEPIIREVISKTLDMAEFLKETYKVEDELWDIYGRRLLWEPDAITKFTSVDEHIDYYNKWMNDRLTWMLNNLT